jgi:CheY-like chemotaxis protein
VEFALDGEEAVALYREALEQNRRFDAVILDLTVPGGIGGRETVGMLRKIDPDVRAIVCSGYSNDPALGDYEKAGFVGIVGKPFKPGELAGMVQEAIAGGGADKTG